MRNRLLSLVTAMLLALPPATHADTGWTLEQLMASLATVTDVEAIFHERKEMAVLERSLEMQGVLRYHAPDNLEKDVLYPEPMRYAISADRIIIEQPDGRRDELSLDQYPLLRIMTESIRATLAGDLQSLQRYYRPQLTGAQNDWCLSLEPIDATVARRVTSIVIRGAETSILSVETEESGGDRSVISITPPAG